MRNVFVADDHRHAILNSRELRNHFLIESLFCASGINLIWSDLDRAVIGGVVPAARPDFLLAPAEMRSEFFLQRRELGILNIGNTGTVQVDGLRHSLGHRDGMYVGMGCREIAFTSDLQDRPARFYLLS